MGRTVTVLAATAAIWMATALLARAGQVATTRALTAADDASQYAYNRNNPRPYGTPPPFKPHRPPRRAPAALAQRRAHRAVGLILNQPGLVGLATILGLSVGTLWLTWLWRLPALLLLPIAGLIAGPVTQILDPDALLGDLLLPVVSLGLAIVLFDESRHLRTHALQRLNGGLFGLVSVALPVAGLIGTAAAYVWLHLSLPLAALLGVLVALTGPRLGGALGREPARPRDLEALLQSEGTLLDVLGTVVVVLLFEAILFGTTSYPQDVPVILVNTLWTGGVVGLIGTGLIGLLLRPDEVPEWLLSPVLLTMVVAGFAIANTLQPDAGFVAVMVMGFTLANWKKVRGRFAPKPDARTHALLTAALLVVLAARLQRSDFAQLDTGCLLFFGSVILMVRPAALTLATLRNGWSWRARLLAAAMAPRGVVAAALATVFALRLAEARLPQAERLVPLTLLVVLGTVALDGLVVVLTSSGLETPPLAEKSSATDR